MAKDSAPAVQDQSHETPFGTLTVKANGTSTMDESTRKGPPPVKLPMKKKYRGG